MSFRAPSTIRYFCFARMCLTPDKRLADVCYDTVRQIRDHVCFFHFKFTFDCVECTSFHTCGDDLIEHYRKSHPELELPDVQSLTPTNYTPERQAQVDGFMENFVHSVKEDTSDLHYGKVEVRELYGVAMPVADANYLCPSAAPDESHQPVATEKSREVPSLGGLRSPVIVGEETLGDFIIRQHRRDFDADSSDSEYQRGRIGGRRQRTKRRRSHIYF